METGEQVPTPDEARRQLQEAEGAREALRYPPMPRWFHPVMALLLAIYMLAQMTDGTRPLAVGAVVVAVLLGQRYWINRDGVRWTAMDLREMTPFLVAVLGTMAGTWAIAAATGADWVWAVGAVVVAGIVLVTGWLYDRSVSR